MIAPKNPKLTKNVASIDDAYVRFRHRSSGTIGSLARDSTNEEDHEADEDRRRDQATDLEVAVQSAVCLLVRPTSSDADRRR